MDLKDELTGIIERFIFQSPDNGFSVFILQSRGSEPVTVTGATANIHPGQQVSLVGTWSMHPKFGKQFNAEQCIATLPTSVIGLKKYLGSGLIKGIGPSYAEKLVNHFGTSILEIIEKEPHRLREVPGVGAGRMEKIIAGWGDQKEIANIMVFLQERNISTTYALKIYKQYKQESVAVLHENPYRLADDIWGIGFKIADQIAQNIGIARDSIQRVKAGMLFAISSAVNNGHLYVELDELKAKTIELLELEDETIAHERMKQALHDLYNTDKIKLLTWQEKHYITLTSFYHSEKGVAAKIKKLQEYKSTVELDLDAVYKFIKIPTHDNDILLNEEQQSGIMACLQSKVTIITGGPGTGKTTLIKKLLAVLEQNHLLYKLAAPTGRAAKRITEGTGRRATTLHRLLEFDFMTRGFVHNEQNALTLNFLIVDEASMIDIFLGLALLRALPLNAHLLLIGDVDQLPSVGAGNFLNDLIASGTVTCVSLKTIFRQAQDSMIIVNAHRINNGEFPATFLPDAKKDFFFIKEEDPTKTIDHIKSILSKVRAYGIKPEDTIVLVPMNRGNAGTQYLNHEMQKLLNPGETDKQCSFRGTMLKINDRVMQIRNNYDKHVFNGDIGTITDINTSDQTLHINFDTRIVEYEMSELDELVLAYAITIHKSQGSEYQAVIIPIFMQHFMLLQRNLIYTAITRAKKLCFFIGQTKAISMAIRNNKSVQRTTFLQQFLTTDLVCR